MDSCLRALADEPFAVWVGFGARAASNEILALLERSGAAVFCTPRGKGIVPETHPRFVGVTGIGGHESVPAWVAEHAPARILVLGSRLGEPSSLFDPRFVPRRGFVHVDVDADVPGRAFPEATTLPVVADVAAFLRELLHRMPPRSAMPPALPVRSAPPPVEAATVPGRVRPEALMDAIQRRVVDGSEAIVLAESGNAFVWATHRLRFATPGRYRASTGVGAMGHAAAGVVGAALATRRRAVAIVGDGAMLMHNEINTAAKYAARAVWIVLNDGRYGMCEQGMDSLGLVADARFPAVDFVAFARAQGADGVRVDDVRELDAALGRALARGRSVRRRRARRSDRARAGERPQPRPGAPARAERRRRGLVPGAFSARIGLIVPASLSETPWKPTPSPPPSTRARPRRPRSPTCATCRTSTNGRSAAACGRVSTTTPGWARRRATRRCFATT